MVDVRSCCVGKFVNTKDSEPSKVAIHRVMVESCACCWRSSHARHSRHHHDIAISVRMIDAPGASAELFVDVCSASSSPVLVESASETQDGYTFRLVAGHCDCSFIGECNGLSDAGVCLFCRSVVLMSCHELSKGVSEVAT
eukprot:1859359-Amphidinium_carterae.1